MKLKTLFVTTDAEGMGRRENPYRPGNSPIATAWQRFEQDNPPLFTYSQNNELIKNERVEVYSEPEWQYEFEPDLEGNTGWDGCLDNNPEHYKPICNTRRIYRQVAIKEEKSNPASGFERCKDTGIDGFTCKCSKPSDCAFYEASSAQPIKKVEEEQVKEGYNDTVHHLPADDTPISQPVKEGEETPTAKQIIDEEALKLFPETYFGVISDCIVTAMERYAKIKINEFAKQQPVTPASNEVKSAEEMLNEAAQNLGHRDAFDMLSNGEPSVNLPIILSRFEAFAAQFAQRDEEKVKEWRIVSENPPKKAMQLISGRWYNDEFLQDVVFFDGITKPAFTHWQPLLPEPNNPNKQY